MICDNCLKDCDKLTDVKQGDNTFELCEQCASAKHLPHYDQLRYKKVKETYPEAVVFIRSGDYYTALGTDVDKVCNALKIEAFPPYDGHPETVNLSSAQMDTHLPKLVRAGHKVILMDELSHSEKKPRTDLDLVQCSPDMFEVGKYNVFFGEEEIGTLEDCTESKGIWIARPFGVVMGSGAYSKESAIAHLMKVRNASITKKQQITLSSNQTSLF